MKKYLAPLGNYVMDDCNQTVADCVDVQHATFFAGSAELYYAAKELGQALSYSAMLIEVPTLYPLIERLRSAVRKMEGQELK